MDKKEFGRKSNLILGTYMKELAYTINMPKIPLIENRKKKLVRKMLKRSHKLTGKPQPLHNFQTNETEWL